MGQYPLVSLDVVAIARKKTPQQQNVDGGFSISCLPVPYGFVAQITAARTDSGIKGVIEPSSMIDRIAIPLFT